MIKANLTELRAVLDAAAPMESAVAEAGSVLVECLRAGGKILTCGNGGSASDALHLAEELIGRYRDDRPALAAISLAADVTALTCIGNDYGFDAVFSRQVEGLGKSGDVLVAFTTSGKSTNILRALETARARGLRTILLSGKGGGPAASLADIALVVPSDNGARVQEVHTLLLHTFLDVVEEGVGK